MRREGAGGKSEHSSLHWVKHIFRWNTHLATDKVHNVTRNTSNSSENSPPGRHRAIAQSLCATLPREAATGTLAPGMSFSHLQHLTPAGAAPVQAVTRELYPQHCTGPLTPRRQNPCLPLRALLQKHWCLTRSMCSKDWKSQGWLQTFTISPKVIFS